MESKTITNASWCPRRSRLVPQFSLHHEGNCCKMRRHLSTFFAKKKKKKKLPSGWQDICFIHQDECSHTLRSTNGWNKETRISKTFNFSSLKDSQIRHLAVKLWNCDISWGRLELLFSGPYLKVIWRDSYSMWESGCLCSKACNSRYWCSWGKYQITALGNDSLADLEF